MSGWSIGARAVVTGVAFFDDIHEPTGVASNGIELHPVLALRCITPQNQIYGPE